ncbi:MAG: hypothetical protein BRD52_00005, partial [Bacteroidetes bacterium SW_4_67_19]
RTNGLNQVPLSSWTGEETAAYPFEFLVDRGGNLRFYCGRAGRHEALRTTVPVADGHWHHVAVTYDPTDEHLCLLLDGTTADSLRPQALPSLSGSLPIAIGGRRPSPAQQNDAAQRRFTGQLDEVRIWPAARSEATLRTLRTRPYSAPEDDDAPFHLSFNADAETERPAWPEGTRRVPTTLTFQSPLRGLQAHTDGQSVTLRWTATTADEADPAEQVPGEPSAQAQREEAHDAFVTSAALACWLGEERSFDPTEHLGGAAPTTGEAKRINRPDTAS